MPWLKCSVGPVCGVEQGRAWRNGHRTGSTACFSCGRGCGGFGNRFHPLIARAIRSRAALACRLRGPLLALLGPGMALHADRLLVHHRRLRYLECGGGEHATDRVSRRLHSGSARLYGLRDRWSKQGPSSITRCRVMRRGGTKQCWRCLLVLHHYSRTSWIEWTSITCPPITSSHVSRSVPRP